ncbi:uncharacterized protein ACOB8E_020192 isoform 1-T1 [Sarcophilus harrisii]
MATSLSAGWLWGRDLVSSRPQRRGLAAALLWKQSLLLAGRPGRGRDPVAGLPGLLALAARLLWKQGLSPSGPRVCDLVAGRPRCQGPIVGYPAGWGRTFWSAVGVSSDPWPARIFVVGPRRPAALVGLPRGLRACRKAGPHWSIAPGWKPGPGPPAVRPSVAVAAAAAAAAAPTVAAPAPPPPPLLLLHFSPLLPMSLPFPDVLFPYLENELEKEMANQFSIFSKKTPVMKSRTLLKMTEQQQKILVK